MSNIKFLILLALTTSLVSCGSHNDTSKPAAAEPTVTEQYVEKADPLLDTDLTNYHDKEVNGLSAKKVTDLNEATIKELYRRPRAATYPDGDRKPRVGEISIEVAQQLLNSIKIHPVVSMEVKEKYEQPDTEIGYCFGRAAYLHWALYKMGVDHRSIRKAWIMGSIHSSDFYWEFHVATIVRVNDGRWIAIDNFTGRLLEVRDWVNFYTPFNVGFKNLRIYISDPTRFSISKGAYSRAQMGVDLARDVDWYRGYFVDLMDWFKTHSLAEVGLPTDLR
ncbi:MAG: hypothetical protein H7061_01015 [Bdellovibrionaceae bacterium]|nr:hypothetical protein [Bdellovibrio sp.]